MYLMKTSPTPSINNPLLPHNSSSGMLLISNIFHAHWPIQFMMTYRPTGRLDTVRMVLHDNSGIVIDIQNP